MMNEAFIDYLKKMAQSHCFHDNDDEDVMVDDYAGGNVDDAFEMGERAGEVTLARSVLTNLGIEWVLEDE
jgi:hypothetical protein